MLNYQQFQPKKILKITVILYICNYQKKKIIFLTYFKPLNMNKGELINRIAEDASLSRSQATEALNSFIKATSDTLKKGDKLTLVGFGTFSVSNRSARKGRNPQTGKEINIPARSVVKFKAGKDLADKI